jgi:hypothetical protein
VQLLEDLFHQVLHLALLPWHHSLSCLLVPLDPARIIVLDDLLKHLLQLLRILLASQYQGLNSFARLLDVALSVGIGRQAVVFTDLLLDFLEVAKDVENK